jgi:hypothetical protein
VTATLTHPEVGSSIGPQGGQTVARTRAGSPTGPRVVRPRREQELLVGLLPRVIRAPGVHCLAVRPSPRAVRPPESVQYNVIQRWDLWWR